MRNLGQKPRSDELKQSASAVATHNILEASKLPPQKSKRTLPIFLSLVLSLGSGFGGGIRSASASPNENSPAANANVSETVTDKEIEKAIEKGVAWLKKEAKKLLKENELKIQNGERPEHAFVKTACFIALALVKSGVSPKDKTFQDLIRFAENNLIFEGTYAHATYSVSCILMAYEAAYVDKDDRTKVKSIPKRVRADISKYTRWLIQNTDERGGWGYPSNFPASHPDLSNTRHAGSGLTAGISLGEKVPANIFKHMADYALSLHAKSFHKVKLIEPGITGGTSSEYFPGGFIDYQGQPVTLASTSEGIYILATALDGLSSLSADTISQDKRYKFDPEYKEKLETAIYEGLAWLQENYDITKNVGESNGDKQHIYGLVALDSAMNKIGRTFIGIHNWRDELAALLVNTQNSDGSWDKGTDPEMWSWDRAEIYTTTFAIQALCGSYKPTREVLSIRTESSEKTTSQASN